MIEFLQVTGVYEAVFFFGGIFLYWIVTKTIRGIQFYNMFSAMVVMSLKLLGGTIEEVSSFRQYRYMKMVEEDEELAERVLQEEEVKFGEWKKVTIERMIGSLPSGFRDLLGFSDWKGAMRILDEIYKKEGRLK